MVEIVKFYIYRFLDFEIVFSSTHLNNGRLFLFKVPKFLGSIGLQNSEVSLCLNENCVG